jgi:hypothetical protein
LLRNWVENETYWSLTETVEFTLGNVNCEIVNNEFTLGNVNCEIVNLEVSTIEWWCKLTILTMLLMSADHLWVCFVTVGFGGELHLESKVTTKFLSTVWLSTKWAYLIAMPLTTWNLDGVQASSINLRWTIWSSFTVLNEFSGQFHLCSWQWHSPANSNTIWSIGSCLLESGRGRWWWEKRVVTLSCLYFTESRRSRHTV